MLINKDIQFLTGCPSIRLKIPNSTDHFPKLDFSGVHFCSLSLHKWYLSLGTNNATVIYYKSEEYLRFSFHLWKIQTQRLDNIMQLSLLPT